MSAASRPPSSDRDFQEALDRIAALERKIADTNLIRDQVAAANATDLASAIALVNSLKSILQADELVA